VRQLGDPSPADTATISELHRYKGLAQEWHEWSAVVATCRDLATRIVEGAA
jgi:hypothetical protein